MARVSDINPNSILLSVKPSYARMILEGSKTVELRRRFSEKFPKDIRILIYATDPVKAIIGECHLKELIKLPLPQLWERSCRDAMISWETFRDYFEGVTSGYGLVLHKTLVYEKPIPLAALKNNNITAPQSYRSVDIVL